MPEFAIARKIGPGRFTLGFVVLLALMCGVTSSTARTVLKSPKNQSLERQRVSGAATDPVVLYAAHSRGNMQLGVANNGTFGTGGQTIEDPFTGDLIPSCEYPRNSNLVYLWIGAFWIGAVVNHDTLVSCGSEDMYETSEFWPEIPELGGQFTYASIDPASKFYNPDIEAYSEEDIICQYYDTLTDPRLVGRDDTDQRGHIPLDLKITQRSMAWSYEYCDDFILFDYRITNIGLNRLNDLYIGIWVDGDALHVSRLNPEGWQDDIVGFYKTHPCPEVPWFEDTVNIAYHADNDGDPSHNDANSWDLYSTRSVAGVRVVRTPSDSLNYSFNWWITNYDNPADDFGPRHQGTQGDPLRSFGARLGTPEGDCNKYYVLSHREFDYNLMEIAVSHTADGWLPPPTEAEEYADGFDCRYLLSFGPFYVDPGQSLPVTFAWVGGENFHQNPTDFADLWDPHQPQNYYNSLNFSDLALNARWASWVYDNPGYDTDDDGYRGEYVLVNPDTDDVESDTFWYRGDGVPDFRGAGAPPAPRIRVIPSVGKLTVRWNGYYSETEPDRFTGIVDFEGYRVYSALDDRSSSFTMLRSYDRENYSRFVWKIVNNEGTWVRDEIPYTREQLYEMYDDTLFYPLSYTRAHPLYYEGIHYYFERQDFNQSSLNEPGGIHKVDSLARNPGTNPELWQKEDLTYDYGEPLPKFYEYEYVFENVLPTVPYYVAVTAFDFGSPKSGLNSLETNPLNNAIEEYAQNPVDSVEANQLDVYVYPNPYRIDASYAQRGYENRDRTKAPDWARRIHFTNLPSVCKIFIYSIDGDQIREIDHNYPEGGPGSMHETWDLITRNTQTVVSGLYYWVVESDGRTQIGKLAIIK